MVLVNQHAILWASRAYSPKGCPLATGQAAIKTSPLTCGVEKVFMFVVCAAAMQLSESAVNLIVA